MRSFVSDRRKHVYNLIPWEADQSRRNAKGSNRLWSIDFLRLKLQSYARTRGLKSQEMVTDSRLFSSMVIRQSLSESNTLRDFVQAVQLEKYRFFGNIFGNIFAKFQADPNKTQRVTSFKHVFLESTDAKLLHLFKSSVMWFFQMTTAGD